MGTDTLVLAEGREGVWPQNSPVSAFLYFIALNFVKLSGTIIYGFSTFKNKKIV